MESHYQYDMLRKNKCLGTDDMVNFLNKKWGVDGVSKHPSNISILLTMYIVIN